MSASHKLPTSCPKCLHLVPKWQLMGENSIIPEWLRDEYYQNFPSYGLQDGGKKGKGNRR